MRLLDDTGDQGAMLIQMDLKKSFVAPTEKQSNKLGLIGELTSPLGVLTGDLDLAHHSCLDELVTSLENIQAYQR